MKPERSGHKLLRKNKVEKQVKDSKFWTEQKQPRGTLQMTQINHCKHANSLPTVSCQQVCIFPSTLLPPSFSYAFFRFPASPHPSLWMSFPIFIWDRPVLQTQTCPTASAHLTHTYSLVPALSWFTLSQEDPFKVGLLPTDLTFRGDWHDIACLQSSGTHPLLVFT